MKIDESDIIQVLNSPVPLTKAEMARILAEKGKYRGSPKKLAERLDRVLGELTSKGLVIEFKKGTKAWKDARELVRIFSRLKPRRVGGLYQANFLAAFSEQLVFLPKIDPETNLGVMAFLHRAIKYGLEPKKDLGYELLNLLMCGKYEKARNEVRLFLYKLPLDYSDLDLIEKILDYGLEFSELPFLPDVNRAKSFLESLAREYRN